MCTCEGGCGLGREGGSVCRAGCSAGSCPGPAHWPAQAPRPASAHPARSVLPRPTLPLVRAQLLNNISFLHTITKSVIKFHVSMRRSLMKLNKSHYDYNLSSHYQRLFILTRCGSRTFHMSKDSANSVR